MASLFAGRNDFGFQSDAKIYPPFPATSRRESRAHERPLMRARLAYIAAISAVKASSVQGVSFKWS
jgi:hypothetical protein